MLESYQNSLPKHLNLKSKYLLHTRHVPGSQPPFSLIPDSDQGKEDISLIYLCCSLWRLYPPFTFDSFLSFAKPKVRENAQDPADPGEPWVGPRKDFCRFPWIFDHFIK